MAYRHCACCLQPALSVDPIPPCSCQVWSVERARVWLKVAPDAFGFKNPGLDAGRSPIPTLSQGIFILTLEQCFSERDRREEGTLLMKGG